jgi:hypothetical protein
MARFAVSGRATIVGTSALPLVSLYATATVAPKVLEVGIWNTTGTSVTVAVVRLTTAGTQGAGLTEVSEDEPDHPAVATAFAGHTVGPTIGGELRRTTLAGTIGAGVIWVPSTFWRINAGTANGIGLIVPTGTGQTLDYSIAWAE